MDLFFIARTITSSVIFRPASQTRSLLINIKAKQAVIAKKVKFHFFSICLLLVCFATSSAHATLLMDWVFNIDGTISEDLYGDPIPTTGELVDGLGTMSLEITGAGTHRAIGYYDFEILRSVNTFAMGLDFSLLEDDIATINYIFTDEMPTVKLSRFYNELLRLRSRALTGGRSESSEMVIAASNINLFLFDIRNGLADIV